MKATLQKDFPKKHTMRIMLLSVLLVLLYATPEEDALDALSNAAI